MGRLATDDTLNKVVDAIKNSETVQAQKEEIQAEGARVLATIPQDYKKTVEEVSLLKEDLSDANNSVSTTADAYTIASADMESGTIDKITGVDGESNNTIRSKDFIDISSTKSFSFSGISANAYYVRIVYYDSSKAFLISTDGIKANEEAVKFVKPNKAKHMRIVIAYISLDSIDYIKPVITYTNLIDGDTITRSVKKENLKHFKTIGKYSKENGLIFHLDKHLKELTAEIPVLRIFYMQKRVMS